MAPHSSRPAGAQARAGRARPAHSADTLDECALVARIRQGDESAFDTVVRAHVDALCRYAALITKSPDAAEEIVQDVLFEIWRRRHELVITSGLRHYLYGAVRNRALNVVRQGQRHARLQSAVEREAAIAADLADGLDPDTRVRALEIDAALRRAVDQLPPRCRAAYQHRAAGLSYAEIASRLGVAVKTVEAHVTTAIKVLRRRLARFR